MRWQDLTIAKIQKYQSVQDWLAEVATRCTGSDKTRKRYIKVLAVYCNYREKTPDQLLAEDRPYRKGKKLTVAEQQLTRYFQWLTKKKIVERGRRKGQKGLSRTTAVSMFGIIRSFLHYNEVFFIRKMPSAGSKAKSSLELPRDKLKSAVEAGDLREKFALTGEASTGMRPADFVRLIYGDIKQDYEAGELRLYIEKISQKEDLKFGVFLSRQATRILRMLIEQRKRDDEEITDDTPLIGHKKGEYEGALSEDQLARIIKGAGERVGIHLTPKMFRKNFRTLASPKIGRDATCKMAAWTIPGVGGNYFLPPKRECLESYRKIEDLFTYEANKKSAEEQQVESLINFAIANNIPMSKVEEIRKIWRSKKLKPDEVAELIRPLTQQQRVMGGGLPYQDMVAKGIEDMLVKVLKGVKRRMKEEEA